MSNTTVSQNDILIRNYGPADREAVRKIAYDTAFLEKPQLFFDDREIVADALTLYFTDYEPQSCFVAVYQDKVIGYLLGTKNFKQMESISHKKLLKELVVKIFRKKMLLNKKFRQLIYQSFKSFIQGEFIIPDYCKNYPALFHVNLDPGFRKMGIGRRLIQSFENYLKNNKIKGVFLSTMTEEAKIFFEKNGYNELFKSRRSYLQYRLSGGRFCYILGKRIDSAD